MNDKNKYDDENITEEPGNEGFGSGREFSGDDDGLSFGSKKEEEGYLPDFADEMEYRTMGREKGGFFSRLFSLPNISVGWLGLFLVVLAALFLFLPEVNRSADKEQITALSDRMKNLEQQWAQMPKPSEAPIPEVADTALIKATNDRVVALEKSLSNTADQFKREMETLKAALAEVRSRPAIEKPAAPVKPATEKKAVSKKPEPSSVKIHTVKAGENLYRIGLKYGLKEAELLKLNNLEKNSIIVPGQKLKVGK